MVGIQLLSGRVPKARNRDYLNLRIETGFRNRAGLDFRVENGSKIATHSGTPIRRSEAVRDGLLARNVHIANVNLRALLTLPTAGYAPPCRFVSRSTPTNFSL